MNSTVAQLGKSVNQVLTATYNSLYSADDENDEQPAQLQLQTSPLAATLEVVSLFTSQLIDLETALPAAMHALGATTDEIEKAWERAKAKNEKECACEDEEREWTKKERDINLKERDANLDATKANTEKTKKESGAGRGAK